LRDGSGNISGKEEKKRRRTKKERTKGSGIKEI
jgi:hypothetical protein